MTIDGVYAGDLKIGDVVRMQAKILRVTRVDRCGPDEVEVVFVKPDDNDQIVLNMNRGQVLERIA